MPKALKDFNIQNKRVNYSELHKENELLAIQLREHRPFYSPKYYNKCLRLADEIEHCATWMRFKVDSNGKKRMFDTRFCRDRLCNICKKVRYNHESARLYRAISYNEQELPENNLHKEDIKHKTNQRYLVGTFTVKNIETSELGKEIKLINYAWSKLTRYQCIQKYLLGTVKRIETPLGKDGKCNLHIHVLMQVKPSFFKGKNSLNHGQWSQLWCKALKSNYTADLHVERIYDTDKLRKTCNYITKVDTTSQKIDWGDPSQVAKLIDIDDELYRKRLIIYTGTLKTADKLVNAMYKRQGKKQSKNDNSGKHNTYSEEDTFNYDDCKVETYVYKSINNSTNYYLKE